MAVAPESPSGNSVTTTPPPAAPAPAPAVTTPTSTPSTTPADRGGSPAAPVDVHRGLMDVATAALKKTATGTVTPKDQGTPAVAPAAPAAKANGAAPAATQVAPDGAGKPAAKDESTSAGAVAEEDDESKPPPFNDHPRWKKMERRLTEATTQLEELKTPAEQYQKIEAFMQRFELSTDDMVMAYDIVARMKHDPVSAFEKLTPIYQELARRAGVVIPEDLRQRIAQGFIDEKSARELAQARAQKQLAEDRAKRANGQMTQATLTQRNVTIQNAVADWDTAQASRNPDFERLRPMVEDAARAIMAKEGKAQDPDAAIVVLDRALKMVTDRLQPFRTPPTPTPRVPTAAGNPATGEVAAEPKSLAEAALQGLKGTYRFK